VFACAEQGGTIAPPDLDAQDNWYHAAEEFLLATLQEGVAFEATTAALDALAPPTIHSATEFPDGIGLITDSCVGAGAAEKPFPELFADMRAAYHNGIYAAASFWWTLGGGSYPPFALSCRGMPNPFLFANMLTGRFTSATD
jgi:type VI secretion system protein ImpM